MKKAHGIAYIVLAAAAFFGITCWKLQESIGFPGSSADAAGKPPYIWGAVLCILILFFAMAVYYATWQAPVFLLRVPAEILIVLEIAVLVICFAVGERITGSSEAVSGLFSAVIIAATAFLIEQFLLQVKGVVNVRGSLICRKVQNKMEAERLAREKAAKPGDESFEEMKKESGVGGISVPMGWTNRPTGI